MGIFDSFSFRGKFLAGNVVTIITAVALTIGFKFHADGLIREIKIDQAASDRTGEHIHAAVLEINRFINGQTPYEDIRRRIDALRSDARWESLAAFDAIASAVRRINALMGENAAVVEKIMTNTDASAELSNAYIDQVVEKLVDPLQESQVSELEKRVIAGAKNNTTNSLKIQALTLEMMADIDKKTALLRFIENLIENVTRDRKMLMNTPFAHMAAQALKNNEAVYKLAQTYIANVEEIQQAHRSIVDNTETLLDQLNRRRDDNRRRSYRKLENALLLFGGVIIGVSAILLIFLFAASGKMSRPLTAATRILEDIARGEGDLTRRIDVHSRDEVGRMGQSFNLFMEKLRRIVKDVADVTASLNAASGQLSAVSDQLASGSTQMAAQAETVAGASEEMSSNINMMAASSEEMGLNAANVSSAASQMSMNMDAVAASVEEMSAALNAAAQNAEESARISKDALDMAREATQTMQRLGEDAENIGRVTQIIGRIAEQTNLLALNATIEAASAGNAGRGFTVVANEIKELARQSAQAAEDISKQIGAVQENTGDAVRVIGRASETIESVTRLVGDITGAVSQQNLAANDISANVSESNVGVNNIAASIAELSKAVDDMSRNIAESAKGANDIAANIQGVKRATDETSENARQVSGAVTHLSDMAAKLQALMGKFIIEAETDGRSDPAGQTGGDAPS